MIVIGTRGLDTPKRLILGSVSSGVVDEFRDSSSSREIDLPHSAPPGQNDKFAR